jgi:predicted Fe-Mo cluster-binding NifX family protein
MKIAVPVTSTNQVDEHFGHCEFYSIYTVSEKNEITKIETIPSVQGCGCKSNIAGVLAAEESAVAP